MEEDTVKLRANCFCYYFLHMFEVKMLMYLSILEETAAKTNSTPGAFASSALGAVPKIGNALKAIANEADKIILSKILSSRSRKLATFVYGYRDNKDKVRDMLLECGLKIFMVFEEQMSKISAAGGVHRAMQKIAVDSVNRYITFHLDHPELDVSINNIAKGVLLGTSISNNCGITNPGRTLLVDGMSWKTSNIFSKVGLCVKENDYFIYYKKYETSPKKYGYRLLFSHEDVDIIKELWTIETNVKNPYQYQLKFENYAAISTSCLEYYLHQYPQREFRYNIEKTLSKACSDRQEKLEIILKSNQDNHEKSIEQINQLKVSTIEAITSSKNDLVKMVTRCYHKNSKDIIENSMKLMARLQSLKDSRIDSDKEELSEMIMRALNNANKSDKQLQEVMTELKYKTDVIHDKQLTKTDACQLLNTNEIYRNEEIVKDILEKLVEKKIEERIAIVRNQEDGLEIDTREVVSSNKNVQELKINNAVNISHENKVESNNISEEENNFENTMQFAEESLRSQAMNFNHDNKARYTNASDEEVHCYEDISENSETCRKLDNGIVEEHAEEKNIANNEPLLNKLDSQEEVDSKVEIPTTMNELEEILQVALEIPSINKFKSKEENMDLIRILFNKVKDKNTSKKRLTQQFSDLMDPSFETDQIRTLLHVIKNRVDDQQNEVLTDIQDVNNTEPISTDTTLRLPKTKVDLQQVKNMHKNINMQRYKELESDYDLIGEGSSRKWNGLLTTKNSDANNKKTAIDRVVSIFRSGRLKKKNHLRPLSYD